MPTVPAMPTAPPLTMLVVIVTDGGVDLDVNHAMRLGFTTA